MNRIMTPQQAARELAQIINKHMYPKPSPEAITAGMQPKG